jgi:hypothetical protein
MVEERAKRKLGAILSENGDILYSSCQEASGCRTGSSKNKGLG